MPSWDWRRMIVEGGAYCAGVLALEWVSGIGLYVSLGVTPWTPAAGLSLAYLYARGVKVGPFVLVGELLTGGLVNAAPIGIAGGIFVACMTTAVWTAAAEMLRALPTFSARLQSTRSLFDLFAVAGSASTAQAVLYVWALWATGAADGAILYSLTWRTGVGNLVGMLVVAPLLLLVHGGGRWPELKVLHGIQLLVLAGALLAIFNFPNATTYQLFYLLFLPLVWVGLRDGVAGAAIVLNLAQVGVIVGTQMRFEAMPGTGALQVLMIALAMTGLLVGAIVAEREGAARRLHEQSAALGRAVRLRSAGETAAAIAHQINQPITAISTYAGVASDALSRGDTTLAQSTLNKLTEQCDRATAVMRSIRDLVKQGSLNPQPIKIQKLVADLRAAHAIACDELGIAFRIDISGNHSTLVADEIQLEQAIDNLLVNSIEAIREAGKPGAIRVSSREVGGETYIEIEDEGPGFASGLEDIATTPFMTTKLNGSGLGLAIARSVAEAHGGSLAVLNRSNGACVRLRLPTTGARNGQDNHTH